MSQIAANWPSAAAENEYQAALAINNVCADLLGGSNARAYSDDQFQSLFGASRSDVRALLHRLESRLDAAIHHA